MLFDSAIDETAEGLVGHVRSPCFVRSRTVSYAPAGRGDSPDHCVTQVTTLTTNFVSPEIHYDEIPCHYRYSLVILA